MVMQNSCKILEDFDLERAKYATCIVRHFAGTSVLPELQIGVANIKPVLKGIHIIRCDEF